MKTITNEFRTMKRVVLLNDADTEYHFNLWEKYGKSRVYVNYRGKKSVGYIDLKDGRYYGDTCKAYTQMVDKFAELYMESQKEYRLVHEDETGKTIYSKWCATPVDDVLIYACNEAYKREHGTFANARQEIREKA